MPKCKTSNVRVTRLPWVRPSVSVRAEEPLQAAFLKRSILDVRVTQVALLYSKLPLGIPAATQTVTKVGMGFWPNFLLLRFYAVHLGTDGTCGSLPGDFVSIHSIHSINRNSIRAKRNSVREAKIIKLHRIGLEIILNPCPSGTPSKPHQLSLGAFSCRNIYQGPLTGLSENCSHPARSREYKMAGGERGEQ